VNDKEFEDILTVAVANILQPEPPDVFKDALAAKAPLPALIEALIDRKKNIANRRHLEAIAALRQGRPEDLNTAAFRSYVLAKTDMTEEELDRCAREIETFRRILEAVAVDQPVTMAARDEDGLGGGPIAAADFLEIYEKSED
jgi:hypothetical protein